MARFASLLLLAGLLLLSLVAAPTTAAALSRDTSDVPSFMLTDEPVHCKNCMNGMPMDGCPLPQACGFEPILCVDCMEGMAMPLCPKPEWCKGVDCTNAKHNCKNGEPTEKCPDPGTCNMEPIRCVGCTPGQYRNACPKPELCAQNMTTPPCMNCMEGMPMDGCPNATACIGAGPMPAPFTPKPDGGGDGGLQCIDCMPGMAMPQCPFPELCATVDCPMRMYFGASVDTCLFFHSWHITRGVQWLGVFFCVLILAFLREGLSVWRVHRAYSRRCEDALRRMYLRDPEAAAKVGVQVRRRGSRADVSPRKQMPLMSDVGDSGNASGGQQHSLTRDMMARSDSEAPYQAVPSPGPSGSPAPGVVALPLPPPESDLALHLFDSTYYTVSLTLGYLLMLLIMTYNIGMCLMVVLLCGLMHFACNYGYVRGVRRPNAERMRQMAKQFSNACAASSAVSAAGASGGAADVLGAASVGGATVNGSLMDGSARMPVTAGDHCCEEINFDDI